MRSVLTSHSKKCPYYVNMADSSKRPKKTPKAATDLQSTPLIVATEKWGFSIPPELKKAMRAKYVPKSEKEIIVIDTELKPVNTKRWNPLRGNLKSKITVQSKHRELSIPERLKLLEAFSIANSGKGVAEHALNLFPELSLAHDATQVALTELPSDAPEIYQGLRGPEAPPEFVKRVYSEWLGKGLTRAHIRKLDPILSTAIENWLKKPGCEWPAEVDLPTLKEQNNRWANRVQNEGLGTVLGDAEPNFALKEAARLRAVLERRKAK